MYGSGCYGEPYIAIRARPQNDDSADAVYELYGKASNLCIFYCSIFPGSWSFGDDCTVRVWNCDGNRYGADFQKDSV